MSFYVSISDANLLVTGFSIFDFAVLFLIHLFSSTVVVVVALANLRCSVFVLIKLSQIGSFHKILVLATECFFSFDIFEIHNDAFSSC